MLSMLPATAYAMADATGVTATQVVRLMRKLGAVHVGTEPTEGGGRGRTVWGLPEAAAEAAK
jgi:predicted ArsR family transcriptional regulator